MRLRLIPIGLFRSRRRKLLTAVLLVAGSVFGANAWLERNASLSVVNGLPLGMVMLIDDVETLYVSERSFREITLPEGRHRVVVVGPKYWPVADEFELRNTWWERFQFWNRPVHVLAPGRTAVVVVERQRQSEPGTEAKIVSQSFSVGRLFATYRGIDLPFADFPARGEFDAERGPLEKTLLYVSQDEDFKRFVTPEMVAAQSAGNVLSYAEAQLLGTPRDGGLLERYWRIALRVEQGDRCVAFLGKQLFRRPPWYDWHRTYQTVCEKLGRRDQLIRQYDDFVEMESKQPGPAYSGMLYLRGRLEQDDDRMQDYMDRAVRSHPGNYFAWYAGAYLLLSQGKLQESEPGFRNAYALQDVRPEFRNRFLGVAVAVGQEPLVRRILTRSQEADLNDQRMLLNALVSANDLTAAAAVQERFARLAERRVPGDPDRLMLQARLHLLYLLGQFDKMVEQTNDLGSHPIRSQALFELGRLNELPSDLVLLERDADVSQQLLLSVAWRRSKDKQRADDRLQQAISLLKLGGPEDRLLAEALQHPGKVTLRQMRSITTDPVRKAVAIVDLVLRGAGPRKELLELASTLNYSRHFPHQFVKRTVSELQEPNPPAKSK